VAGLRLALMPSQLHLELETPFSKCCGGKFVAGVTKVVVN
jgi:hypothetical protein